MKLLVFLAATLWCSSAYCLTKSEAVALSKSRISGLKDHYAQLAYNCFMFEEDCQINGNSQSATLKWLAFEFRKSPPQIEYDRGSDKFFIDGAVRIAKTGKDWGSPVIFNEDLLAMEKTPGNYVALSFYEALGVLVHEFGHHQETGLVKYGLRALDHHELDLIAVHVTSYLKDRSRELRITSEDVPGLLPEAEVTLYQIELEFDNGVRNIWSNIFVDSISETKEVSAGLYKSIACPIERTDGHITFQGYASAAAFRQLRAPSFTADESEVVVKQAVGDASVMCIDKQMNVFQIFNGYTNGLLELHFSFANGGLIFEKSSSFKATPPK